MNTHRQAIILDSEAFSALVRNDDAFVALFNELDIQGVEFLLSANTIIEGTDPKTHPAQLRQVLKGLKVEPVTEESAIAALRLLKEANVHGHSHAIDATVAEVALRQEGPTTILTSDLKDMRKLTDGRVNVEKV